MLLPDRHDPENERSMSMHGYVARKRDRYYAVIYEGLDPVTGRERRRWHPAGCDRLEAERLAERLAGESKGRNDEIRSLTFGAYSLGDGCQARSSRCRPARTAATSTRWTATSSRPWGRPACER